MYLLKVKRLEDLTATFLHRDSIGSPEPVASHLFLFLNVNEEIITFFLFILILAVFSLHSAASMMNQDHFFTSWTHAHTL